jgi:hypothetical protein
MASTRLICCSTRLTITTMKAATAGIWHQQQHAWRC